MQAKRCGHRPGKEIVSQQEMVDRVKSGSGCAHRSRIRHHGAHRCARGARASTAALERAVACVEAGADMIFPEAMTDLAMYRRFKDAVKVPILANITEFGQTPLYTRDELASVGVDIVLYCCSAYRAMNAAALATYRGHPPRRHAEERRGSNADARRSVQVSRLSRVRSKTGRIVCRGEREMSESQAGRIQTEEIRGVIGCYRGQHGALHRRHDRQRSALPRL